MSTKKFRKKTIQEPKVLNDLLGFAGSSAAGYDSCVGRSYTEMAEVFEPYGTVFRLTSL